MYREWKKIEFPKDYYIWIWEQEDWKVDQEIDGKMGWERNGRSSWEQQGIAEFCTCQWIEWNEHSGNWTSHKAWVILTDTIQKQYANFQYKLPIANLIKICSVLQ